MPFPSGVVYVVGIVEPGANPLVGVPGFNTAVREISSQTTLDNTSSITQSPLSSSSTVTKEPLGTIGSNDTNPPSPELTVFNLAQEHNSGVTVSL